MRADWPGPEAPRRDGRSDPRVSQPHESRAGSKGNLSDRAGGRGMHSGAGGGRCWPRALGARGSRVLSKALGRGAREHRARNPRGRVQAALVVLREGHR